MSVSRREIVTTGVPGVALLLAAYALGHRANKPTEKPNAANANMLRLQSRDGRTLRLADQPRSPEGWLVYGFRRTCHWCQSNHQAVNSIAEQLRGRVSCIGVIIDDDWPPPTDYVFPIYRESDPQHSVFLTTPTTWLVEAQSNRVTLSMEGAYIGPVRDLLVQTFGVDLATAL